MDHLGIVALVLGTPITAVMAHTQGSIPLDLRVGLLNLISMSCGESGQIRCHT